MTTLHSFLEVLLIPIGGTSCILLLPLSCDMAKNTYPVCDYAVENWHMPNLISTDRAALGQKN